MKTSHYLITGREKDLMLEYLRCIENIVNNYYVIISDNDIERLRENIRKIKDILN